MQPKRYLGPMKPQISYAMLMTLSMGFLMACGSAETPSRETAASISAPATPAAKAAPAVQGGPQVIGSLQNPNFKEGTNDQNRGDKSGTVALKGTVKTSSSYVYLFETEGRNNAVVDSARIQDGAFDFGGIEISRGFYGLGIKRGKANTRIILNPDEPNVHLDYTNSRMTSALTESKENKGWYAFNGAAGAINNSIRAMRKKRKGNEVAIDAQIVLKESELVRTQHNFIDQNQGTYLAKYLGWQNPKFIGDRGSYFNDIDMTDNSLVHSMALPDRIQSFMRTFSQGNESGFLACIDLVKSSVEDNPVVLEFALYNMLDGFYNTGMEAICQYILDNYIFDEDCGANLSDVIRQRAEGIINLQVGKTPPNFNIPNPNGQMVDLNRYCSEHEYTLVMFWASWCHKCEQEIPNLVPMYENFNPRGFGLIGVSVDQTPQAWSAAIENNNIPWENVSQLQGWDAPVTDDFKITQTPTYFLLNREREIVLKPKRWFDINNFLKSKL